MCFEHCSEKEYDFGYVNVLFVLLDACEVGFMTLCAFPLRVFLWKVVLVSFADVSLLERVVDFAA